MNKEFTDLLDKMRKIHNLKNEDYAQANKPFENFERSAILMKWFNDHNDKAFVALIATKLARLATLLNSKKEPNNESVADSFLDLTTYCALWSSYHSSSTEQIIGNTINKGYPFVCSICSNGFKAEASLRAHLFAFHDIKY